MTLLLYLIFLFLSFVFENEFALVGWSLFPYKYAAFVSPWMTAVRLSDHWTLWDD